MSLPTNIHRFFWVSMGFLSMFGALFHNVATDVVIVEVPQSCDVGRFDQVHLHVELLCWSSEHSSFRAESSLGCGRLGAELFPVSQQRGVPRNGGIQALVGLFYGKSHENG